MNDYFSKQKAFEKVGKLIETLVEFADVPKGTTGTVTRADPAGRDGWSLAIQWHLPTEEQEPFRFRFLGGQIEGEDKLVTIIRIGKPLVDWFSKTEYEKFLKELPKCTD